MKPFYQALVSEETQQVTLAGLLHSYARHDVEHPRILVVGSSLLTASAYVRDTLRGSIIPKSIAVMDVHCGYVPRYKESESRAASKMDTDEFNPLCAIQYVFLLPDVLTLNDDYWEKLAFKIFMVLSRNRGVKIFLREEYSVPFYEALYRVWMGSNIRIHTERDPFRTYVTLQASDLMLMISGAIESDDRAYENAHVSLGEKAIIVSPEYLLGKVLSHSGLLSKAESVLVTDELARKLFLHCASAAPVTEHSHIVTAT